MPEIERTWQGSNAPYNPHSKYDQEWQRSNFQYDTGKRPRQASDTQNNKKRQDHTGETRFRFLPYGNILQENTDEDIISSHSTPETMEEADNARKILNKYITKRPVYYSDDSLFDFINIIHKINPVESEYFRKKIEISE